MINESWTELENLRCHPAKRPFETSCILVLINIREHFSIAFTITIHASVATIKFMFYFLHVSLSLTFALSSTVH